MTSNDNRIYTKPISDVDSTSIDICSAFIMSQWGLFIPGRTTDAYKNIFNNCAKSDGIPHFEVAFVGEQTVGIAGVRDREPYLPENIDYGPWLTMVFVHGNYRDQGVGSKLVTSIERYTEAQGFKEMYLDTADGGKLYKNLGWKFYEEIPNPIDENGSATSEILIKRFG